MPVGDEPLVDSEGGSLLLVVADLRRLKVEPSGPRPVDSIVSMCYVWWGRERESIVRV